MTDEYAARFSELSNIETPSQSEWLEIFEIYNHCWNTSVSPCGSCDKTKGINKAVFNKLMKLHTKQTKDGKEEPAY